MNDANQKLAEKQASLADARAKLQAVKDKLESLQKQYEEKLATKEDLRKKAELTEQRLDRAAKLVHGLAGERVRWEASVKVRALYIHTHVCQSFNALTLCVYAKCSL